MTLEQAVPTPQCARHGDRRPADGGAHPGPVLEHDRLRAPARPESGGRQPLPRHSVVVVDEFDPSRTLRPGIAYEGEPAAPQRAQQRLGDANGRGRRDRRVRRVPAGAVDLRRSLGRVRSPRGRGEGRLCCPGNVHRRLSYAFEAPAGGHPAPTKMAAVIRPPGAVSWRHRRRNSRACNVLAYFFLQICCLYIVLTCSEVRCLSLG